MVWWLWIIPILAVMAYLLLRLARPQYVRGVPFAAVRPLLERFVADARPGSVLVLEREGDPGVLQLAVRRSFGSEPTIEFGLPSVDWSVQRFDDVADALERAGFPSQKESGGSCRTVRRFLRVAAPGSGDRMAAEGWGMLSVALESLGWERETKFTIHTENPLGTQALGGLARMHRGSAND